MEIFKTIFELRNKLKQYRKQTIGFVPTMGALHAGHLSLIEKSKAQNDITAVSIFVNPTQFGAGEDLDKYPKTLEKDLKKCQNTGVDFVFTPDKKTIYPSEHFTEIVPPSNLENKLCGESRKGHFKGVCTVVLKLFNMVQPTRAYFGQKDIQQFIIIKKMVEDLNIPVELVRCPIIREVDGLAMSSRNSYLSAEDREKASAIYKALCRAKENNIEKAKDILKDFDVEYFTAVGYDNLETVDELSAGTIIAIAANLNGTRLIDNIILEDYVNN